MCGYYVNVKGISSLSVKLLTEVEYTNRSWKAYAMIGYKTFEALLDRDNLEFNDAEIS